MKHRYFKKLAIAIMLLSTLFAIRCKQNEDKFEILYFDRNSFDSISILKSEIIDFNTPVNPSSFQIIEDTIILVNNWQENTHYNELYGLKGRQLITKFARRGKGPNEWLTASASYDSNINGGLFLVTNTPHQSAFFHIDSLLKYKHEYFPKPFPIPEFFSIQITMLNDSIALAFNKFYLDDIRFGNKNTECIYPFNIRNTNKAIYREGYLWKKNFTHNVTGGDIAVSPNSDRVVVFFAYKNRFEIYDKKMRLLKRFEGPERTQPEYYVRDAETNAISFKKRLKAFDGLFYTKDYIYVIYDGEYNHKKAMPTEVFKIGWNGELLHRYILSEKDFSRFRRLSVDSKEEYLYATKVIDNNYPQLVRFKLP